MPNTKILSCRAIVASLLLGVAQAVAQAQPRQGVKSCALLTRDLVAKVAASTKRSVDAAGPKELPLGAIGTACEWGDVTLHVDMWTPARLEELRKQDGKHWEVIKGVGDAAYLHNVGDAMAELFVRTGSRTFGLMITVPVGSTTAAIKPTVVSAANDIVAKLR